MDAIQTWYPALDQAHVTNLSNQLITSSRHLFTSPRHQLITSLRHHHFTNHRYQHVTSMICSTLIQLPHCTQSSTIFSHQQIQADSNGKCAWEEQQTQDSIKSVHPCTETCKRIFFRSCSDGIMYSKWWTKLTWSTTRGAIPTQDCCVPVVSMVLEGTTGLRAVTGWLHDINQTGMQETLPVTKGTCSYMYYMITCTNAIIWLLSCTYIYTT